MCKNTNYLGTEIEPILLLVFNIKGIAPLDVTS